MRSVFRATRRSEVETVMGRRFDPKSTDPQSHIPLPNLSRASPFGGLPCSLGYREMANRPSQPVLLEESQLLRGFRPIAKAEGISFLDPVPMFADPGELARAGLRDDSGTQQTIQQLICFGVTPV